MSQLCRNSLALIGLLALDFASVALAGIPTNRFTISALGGGQGGKVLYVVVEKGELALGSAAPLGDGGLDTKDTPDRWYVMGTKIKSTVGGGYLAYDPTGREEGVTLAAKPDGEGTDWIVKRPDGRVRRKNEKRSVDEEWGVLQAASGPMKGWFLDVEEKNVKHEDGVSATLRRFILTKEPRWNIEVGRIYTHK